MAEENIEGIHNYCDRWCERCAFTKRCAVFQSEQEESVPNKEPGTQAFWERVSENFTKAKSKLEQIAEQSGIDLQILTEEIEKAEQRRSENRKLARDHELSRVAVEYSEQARSWLQTQPGMLDKLEQLKAELTLGVESREAARVQIETIKESLAIINWDASFIQTKLFRALQGKFENISSNEQDEVVDDHNGSAKVALISIDRSREAWQKIFGLLPEHEDIFIEVLAKLEKIKRLTIFEFPRALEFVRPGFDQ